MLVQKLILKAEVIEDLKILSIDRSKYKGLINDFCEQYHSENNEPRPAICNLMVNEFYGLVGHEKDWIRKKIDEKYKPYHRVRNGKLRGNKLRLKKIPQKINKLEEQFAELTKHTLDFVTNG